MNKNYHQVPPDRPIQRHDVSAASVERNARPSAAGPGSKNPSVQSEVCWNIWELQTNTCSFQTQSWRQRACFHHRVRKGSAAGGTTQRPAEPGAVSCLKVSGAVSSCSGLLCLCGPGRRKHLTLFLSELSVMLDSCIGIRIINAEIQCL